MSLILELQALQRQRSITLKSRNMIANRLQAIMAGALGYHSGMTGTDRVKKFREARTVIKAVVDGTLTHNLHRIIETTMIGIDQQDVLKKALEDEMVRIAEQLPIAAWIEQPEQRGFAYLGLAIVLGETGDLALYANPAKVWRRLGCAPWTFNGQTRIGATWRSGKEGKLPAEEWEKFGYSPRRRSLAYLIGEGLMKQNFLKHGKAGDDESETDEAPAGPYRLRYDTAKALAQQNHPDWKPLRCHLHGMLLAAKLLLKNLWIEWHRGGESSVVADSRHAALATH